MKVSQGRVVSGDKKVDKKGAAEKGMKKKRELCNWGEV
jgi:hypothetical protein